MRGAIASPAGSPSAARARRCALALAALCASLAALAFTPASALAVTFHRFSTSFGAAGSTPSNPYPLSGPSSVAVDSSTHDVYVTDPPNAWVEKFDPSGNLILIFGKGVDQTTGGDVCDIQANPTDVCQPGTQADGSGAPIGAFNTPTFVAVDNSGGPPHDVYVADTGDNLVQKFAPDGTLIASWGDSSLNASAPNGQLDGSTATDGPFGSMAGIAVDTSGTLYVFDGSTLFEFAPNGTFNTDFGLPYGTTPAGIAADSAGNIYKVRGVPFVEKLDPSGNDIGPVTSDHAATGLAIDPSTNDLYVDQGGGSRIDHYDPSCDPTYGPCTIAGSFGSGHLSAAAGLAVDSSNGTVYAADTGGGDVAVFALETETLPTVDATSASDLTQSSATLNAQINPGFGDTVYRFRYGTDASYGSSTLISDSIGNDNADHAVSAGLGGLTPATTYHYQAVAINFLGTVHGPDQTFTTPAAPLVSSSSASAITQTSATLGASINPRLSSTTYHFEYGTTASYGSHTPESAPLGADSSAHPGSAAITGLTAGTVYHYRVVATNAVDATDGPDQTFTTAAPPPVVTPPPPPTACKKGFVKRHGACVKKKTHRKRRHHKRSASHG